MSDINLPDTFVVFDMEWTAWKGSMNRGWSGPGEYREIYDIGAVQVTGEAFTIRGTYRQLIKLELVPALPAYSTKLTGITQKDIEEGGVGWREAVSAFKEFVGNRPAYAWGHDGDVLIENCRLKNIPNPFSPDQFRNMREIFKACGVPADNYYSSTIVEYFGEHNTHTAHQGLDDALNIVEALKLLRAKVG